MSGPVGWAKARPSNISACHKFCAPCPRGSGSSSSPRGHGARKNCENAERNEVRAPLPTYGSNAIRFQRIRSSRGRRQSGASTCARRRSESVLAFIRSEHSTLPALRSPDERSEIRVRLLRISLRSCGLRLPPRALRRPPARFSYGKSNARISELSSRAVMVKPASSCSATPSPAPAALPLTSTDPRTI